MKQATLFLCFCILLSCATTKNNGNKSTRLDGTWIPVKQEIGGRAIPNAVFEKQQLILKDTTYTVIAESVDKGVVRYTNDKIDIYGKEGVNAGKHFMAIYKLENGELTICYNLAGTNYPESFETKAQSLYFLSVFKKENVK